MVTSNNDPRLLHVYEVRAERREATTRSTLKKMLTDVMSALEEHQKLTIFVERAD